MPLFTCGSVHQGDERFSSDFRGKQCSFTSLIQTNSSVEQTIPMCEWNCQTVDNILSLGDPKGIALVMSFENIDDLEYHLHSLS